MARKKKGYTKDEKGLLKIIYFLEDSLNEIYLIKLINNKNENIINIYEIIEDKHSLKTYLSKIILNIIFK